MQRSMKKTAAAIAAGAAAMTVATAASAQSQDYVSVSGAFSLLQNSDNDGAFTGPFTTGQGTTIPAGVVLAPGTAVGWNTDFNRGFAFSAAYGKRYGGLRGEIELAYQRNGVNEHRGVFAGAIPLDAEDAGVLVTGSGPLGVTVANLVANDDGRSRTIFVMANALYDIDAGWGLKPYFGGGVGVGFINVLYEPGGVTIIDDGSTKFAWQAMAGASLAVTPGAELFAGYRYRKTGNATVASSLLPADFEVQNRGSLVEAGLRFSF